MTNGRRSMASMARVGWAFALTCTSALIACSGATTTSSSAPSEGVAIPNASAIDEDDTTTAHAKKCGDGDTGLDGVAFPAGTTATISGAYAGTGADTIDGDITTRWNSGATTGSIQYAFPSRTNFRGVQIIPGALPNGLETYTFTGYRGTKAIALGSYTVNVVDSEAEAPIEFAHGGEYDGLRIDVADAGSDTSWIAIYEVSLLTKKCDGGQDAGTDSGANDAGISDAGSDSGSVDAGAPWVVLRCVEQSDGDTQMGYWVDSDGSVNSESGMSPPALPAAGSVDNWSGSRSVGTPLTPAALSALLAAAQEVDTSTDGSTTTTGSSPQDMAATSSISAAGSYGENVSVMTYSRDAGTYKRVQSNAPDAMTVINDCSALYYNPI